MTIHEIYISDGVREGLEKRLAANVYKKYRDKVILRDLKNALKNKI